MKRLVLVFVLVASVAFAGALPRGEQKVEADGVLALSGVWLEVIADGEVQLVLTMRDMWGNTEDWPLEGDQYYTILAGAPRELGDGRSSLVSVDITLVDATFAVFSWR